MRGFDQALIVGNLAVFCNSIYIKLRIITELPSFVSFHFASVYQRRRQKIYIVEPHKFDENEMFNILIISAREWIAVLFVYRVSKILRTICGCVGAPPEYNVPLYPNFWMKTDLRGCG